MGGPSSGNPDHEQYCNQHPCWMREETVAYLTVKQIDNDKEEVSLKMRGGKHGNDCPDSGCVYIMGVKFNGTVNAQTERPHPHNSPLPGHEKPGLFNPGDTILNKPIGIRVSDSFQGLAQIY